MNGISQILNLLRKETKSTGTDYVGTVTRVEGNTAYVRLAGADIDDTPVKMSISAQKGDTVRVRVNKGKAWITGNDSAPPTDDTEAKVAQQAIDEQQKHFWYDSTGAHVSGKDGFQNDIRSDGMHIIKSGTEVAKFGTETVIRTVDGTELAHFGYAQGVGSSGTETAPYYTFGSRNSGSIGNYSVAEGVNTTAKNYCTHAEGYASSASGTFGSSHAEGAYTTASGSYSHSEGHTTVASANCAHAQNSHTIAASFAQTALGKYNVEDTSSAYAVIIGNGTSDSDRSNCLAVDWDGYVRCAGIIFGSSSNYRKLVFQSDGNMVIYDSSDNVLWQSGTT